MTSRKSHHEILKMFQRPFHPGRTFTKTTFWCSAFREKGMGYTRETWLVVKLAVKFQSNDIVSLSFWDRLSKASRFVRFSCDVAVVTKNPYDCRRFPAKQKTRNERNLPSRAFSSASFSPEMCVKAVHVTVTHSFGESWCQQFMLILC